MLNVVMLSVVVPLYHTHKYYTVLENFPGTNALAYFCFCANVSDEIKFCEFEPVANVIILFSAIITSLSV